MRGSAQQGRDPQGIRRASGPWFSFAAFTDVGPRAHNEDTYEIDIAASADGGPALFLVADGMGGAQAGEVASRLAVETVQQEIEDALPGPHDERAWNPGWLEEMLGRAVGATNARIYRQARHPDRSGMGTTLVALLLVPRLQQAVLAHVGDSRIYRLRAGDLEQLTTDHCLANLPEAQQWSPEMRGALPKNVITRAVGTSETVEPDTAVRSAKPGDVFLLASDGLDLEPDHIGLCLARAVPRGDVAGAAELLRDQVLGRGATDNVTGLVVRVNGGVR